MIRLAVDLPDFIWLKRRHKKRRPHQSPFLRAG